MGLRRFPSASDFVSCLQLGLIGGGRPGTPRLWEGAARPLVGFRSPLTGWILQLPIRDVEKRASEKACWITNTLMIINYGVDDGFGIDGVPQAIQGDQGLTSANRGKFEQEIRKSATRNLLLKKT